MGETPMLPGGNDVMTQTAQTTDAERDRDPARGALRELVTLCSQCAVRETQVEQEHRETLEQAEKELARAKSNLEMRVKSTRDEVQQKYQSRIDQINQQFQTDIAELKSTDEARRRRINDDYEKTHAEISNKIQQANWLAERGYEGVRNGLTDEATRGKEAHAKEVEGLEELEKNADVVIRSFRQQPPGDVVIPDEKLPEGQADELFAGAKAQAEGHMLALKSLSLPRLFKGIKPFIIAIPLCAIAALIADWAAAGHPTTNEQLRALPLDPKVISLTVLGTLVVLGGIAAILYFVAKSQVKHAYMPLKKAMADARQASKAVLAAQHEARESKRARALHKRNMETQAVKLQYAPQLSRAAKNRDASIQTIQTDYAHKLERIEVQRDKALAETSAWHAQNTASIDSRIEQESSAATARYDAT